MPLNRDLLVLEPNLFRDVLWLGQRLLVGEASLTGAALTLTTPGLTFSGISAGDVIVINTTYCEIVSIDADTLATISLIRSSTDDPPHPPPAGTGLAVGVTTFAPQIALAERQTLAIFGLTPADLPAITNRQVLDDLVALAALLLIYSAAAALAPPGAPAEARLAHHRARFSALRARAAIQIDFDNDGEPDALRRASVAPLVRS